MTENQSFTEAINELDRLTDEESDRWLRENKRAGVFGAVVGMFGSFFKSYFLEGRCKKGVSGLFYSVNAGMRPFLSFAKYWEKKRNKTTL